MSNLSTPASAMPHATSKPSSFVAGYELETSGEVYVSSTSFVVPAVKGCSSTDAGIMPGSDVQSPSSFDAGGVFVGCLNGKARYFLSLIVNGVTHNYESLAVHPGDTIVTSTAAGGAGTKVSVADRTRKSVKKSLTGHRLGEVGYPDIGDLPASASNTSPSLTTVPDFGKMNFSNAKIDGFPIGAYKNIYRYDLYDSSLTTLKISTSSLGSGKHSFHTTFVHP